MGNKGQQTKRQTVLHSGWCDTHHHTSTREEDVDLNTARCAQVCYKTHIVFGPGRLEGLRSDVHV